MNKYCLRLRHPRSDYLQVIRKFTNQIRVTNYSIISKQTWITPFFLQINEAFSLSHRTVRQSPFLILMHFIICCRTGCETPHFLHTEWYYCSIVQYTRNYSVFSSILTVQYSTYICGSWNGGVKTQERGELSIQRKQRASSSNWSPICQLVLSAVRSNTKACAHPISWMRVGEMNKLKDR